MVFKRLKDNDSGYVMTTVIFMIIIMSIVAYAALLQANNGLNLAYKQSYIQMARVASKAAIDYAQEQFDRAPCGTYDGSPEQELVANDRYRLTFTAEVIDTSADGLEKTVRGTGSIYLPKLSATAKYVFDIRSEIIRTYALCKTPLDFGPVVWLDASDASTLKRIGPPTTSASGQVGLGVLDLVTPNDTVEELVSNGQQGLLSWLSSDIELHFCDSLEFALLTCISAGQRDLYAGMVFPGFNIPAGATVTSATIQMTGATPSGSGGRVTHRIYGLYNTATNPHLPLFTALGTNQVRSRVTNPALRTSEFQDHATNNLPPGNPVNFDVTDIVQEMVNNSNWDAANNGGRVGFSFQRQSGSGTRRTCKGNLVSLDIGCWGKGPRLSVTYTTNTLFPANHGDSLAEWQDKSGYANHARSAYGTAPTRQDNQINGLSVVRFNNGTMLSSLTSTLTDKREMTVLAVTKPNFTTSAHDGRMVTGMSTSANNDTTLGSSIIPLLRNGSGNGFSNLYAGSAASNRTDFSCGAVCAGTPYIFSSIFAIDPTNDTMTSTLKGNGAPVASKTGISPSGSPYTFTIDQFYYGGRRNGSSVSAAGTDYLNGDYAEIIIYDKLLECRQIEALEEYLRNKWAISASAYPTTCPADVIPTL